MEKFEAKCDEVKFIRRQLTIESNESNKLAEQVQKGKYLLLYTRYLNDIIYRFIKN